MSGDPSAMRAGGPAPKVRYDFSLVTDYDVYLFKEGHHFRLYEKLGSHLADAGGEKGSFFAVWAPNAGFVSVIGDFNGWDNSSHPLAARLDGSGIWEGFIPGVEKGALYKYHVRSRYNNYTAEKGDPFALLWEEPPGTASIVWELSYGWNDKEWPETRSRRNALDSPMSVYEMHLGSWMRPKDGPSRFLNYRNIAPLLADYLTETGFTHVEFMPVMEHPFYGSWGYQICGYFAPSARYGSPEDFMYLIDHLHQKGIGVILDWVPSHFPSDKHGLSFFDGTHLYEHADPRKGFHPDWKSYIFNYGRNEVRNFLISNAMFWCDKYKADGLRIDAVASMLYMDYSRRDGEWIPNEFGGRENLEAISFLKTLNENIYKEFPHIQTIAEESTAWPMVTKPVDLGGLGFGMKWNMGWMHDTLAYMSTDPVYRKHDHGKLTFGLLYAFSENFMLPLSHDEVVYGKQSLADKLPGTAEQKMSQLRALFGYMYAHPGKKLIFMGGEFGQWQEWDHESTLDWGLAGSPQHSSVKRFVSDLNRIYKSEKALFELDFSDKGFEWIEVNDRDRSVFAFLRKAAGPDDIILAVCNFTPVRRDGYVLGVPRGGEWKEIVNSDSDYYEGTGAGNMGEVAAKPSPSHGRPYSVSLTLPPFGMLLLKPVAPPAEDAKGDTGEKTA